MESASDDRVTFHAPELDHEIARFRAALSASRSAAQLKLFDFLAERSSDPRAPKEIEIALAVFGGDSSLSDGATDSGVRVYVHRLRKRIDEFYSGRDGPRLVIPKGEYRLTLQQPATPDAEIGVVAWSLAALTRPTRWHWFALTALLCLVVAAAMILPAVSSDDEGRKLAATRFWSGIDESAPVALLAGDSFMLAETRDQTKVDRVIRDGNIQSREQLGQHLKSHPDEFYRLYDLDLHYAPASTVQAMWDLQAALPPTRSGKVRKSFVLPLSGADEKTLRSPTIIYVGRLADLGPLYDTYRATSKLVPEGTGAVRDLATGKTFAASDAERLGANGAASIDFGTIASIRTADGRRLIFITGIGDLAVTELARMITDAAALSQLEAQSRTGRSYEALFEVRTLDGIQTERRLLAVYASN